MSEKGEFKTAREADDMLRSLHRAAGYCTGESSARRMGERIREVEAEKERLEQKESRRGR